MRVLVSLLLLLSPPAFAQNADPALLKYVESIPAIDDHAHVVAPDIAHDTGYDALRCDQLPAGAGLDMANLRFGWQTRMTWKFLYGSVPATPEEAEARLPQVQAPLRKEKGTGYFDWALQRAGIATVLANRTQMPPEIKPPHFLWVPYDDALLFPLDNAALQQANSDRNALFAMEEALLKRYYAESGVSERPATLDEYIEKLVRPTLQRQKSAGAPAIKFEVAYLRSLNFARASVDDAAAAWSRAASRVPSSADYTLIQNYIFHAIALEAGRLGLVIQIHTGVGCGIFFDDRGSDPMLLTATFLDPSLRSTNFVMLHGGTPFNMHPASLILKPNVYVDTSVLEFFFSPSEMARILRPWLEMMPEHILFGTDSGPFGPGMGWEETAWLGSHNARRAVAIALTGMILDGVIDAARARQIAAGIFHDNAAKLYGVK